MKINTKKTAIQIGILLATIQIVITVFLYFLEIKNAFTNVNYGMSILATTIIFGIISILLTKRKLEGLITFKECFTAYFTTIVVASFASLLFNFAFFNFYVPDTKVDAIKVEMTEYHIDIMKKNGETTEAINKVINESKNFEPFSFNSSFQSAVKYLLRDCVFGFVLALLFRNYKQENV